MGRDYVGAHDAGEAARLEAQEAGALEELRGALALHPVGEGARVLELGCGGGVFTSALLAALPGATVVATDRDERLLAHARQRLEDEAQAGRVRFERVDAAALPYPARSFDLVACRCVLMHQAEPLVVAGEMFRVAEVGGVALAIEPDWGARALYPDEGALAALLDLARRARPFGFPDVTLGRRLFALLRAVGFERARVRPTAFAETAADMTQDEDEGEGVTGPGRLLEQARTLVRSNGVATDAEIDDLIARLAEARRHPEYFSAGVDFAVVGVKPEPRYEGI